jgi:predicted DNA-binding ribbon-helix-helix protein
VKKISITISGHRTSITLEQEFIDALKAIATRQKKSVSELIKEIDANKKTKSLTSAIRIFILVNKSSH